MGANNNSLTDQFGREHDYLRISLTERCNLRCFYCMPEEGIQLKENDAYITQSEIISIAKIFVSLGVKKIRLTGGEPLIRKDIAEILKGLSMLPVEIAITTNGILLDRYMSLLKELKIFSINVSLDTLQEDRFNKITRKNYYQRVKENIYLLLKNNFNVKLNAVLIRGINDDELIDFVEFTRNNNIHYRFIEFMPFNGNKWDWSKGISHEEIISKITDIYGSTLIKLTDRKNDTSKNYKIDNFAGSFAIISSITNPFCDTCNRIRLTADGKIKNCLFSGSETDILSAFRLGDSIEELIKESIYNKKKIRAGLNSFKDVVSSDQFGWKRAMVSIGG